MPPRKRAAVATDDYLPRGLEDVHRHAFVQHLMAARHLPEAEAKAALRRMLPAATGAARARGRAACAPPAPAPPARRRPPG